MTKSARTETKLSMSDFPARNQDLVRIWLEEPSCVPEQYIFHALKSPGLTAAQLRGAKQ